MVFCEKIKFYKHQNQATMRKQGIKKELTAIGHKAEALDIIEKGNFFDKKKIIIIKIEDKIYTAAITTSEKGTLISFI